MADRTRALAMHGSQLRVFKALWSVKGESKRLLEEEGRERARSSQAL
jgi:hypothetical protein